ncbi:VOC family protein [Oryzicola mucosus]|uniref:VOC family protein n=1 Tax=Oryzicola mucosus TaxID=2767425 RepID=A0A8J6Q5N9_9HYPH|nr:VOC family protein [Oryzicola mucosus]
MRRRARAPPGRRPRPRSICRSKRRRGSTPSAGRRHACPYGFHHVGFRVDGVDATFAALKQRGVTFLSEPLDFEACNRRFAVFADPWNNVIEIDAPIVPDSPVSQ